MGDVYHRGEYANWRKVLADRAPDVQGIYITRRLLLCNLRPPAIIHNEI